MIYKHDNKGNLIHAVDNLGDVWIWEYDANGNMTHHKGPGNEFWKEYDSQNREIKYVCGNTAVVTKYEDDGSFVQTSIETT